MAWAAGRSVGWRGTVWIEGFFHHRVVELCHLFGGDFHRLSVPVEVSLVIVGKTAETGHVAALDVGVDGEQVVEVGHRLVDGEAMQFGGGKSASCRSHVF